MRILLALPTAGDAFRLTSFYFNTGEWNADDADYYDARR